MNPFIQQKKQEFDDIIEFTKKEFSHIRSGRAHADMIDQIPIEAYGTRTPLMQLASISVPEASSMVVDPYDKSIIKDIERSLSQILQAGMSVSNEGTLLRIHISPLTEERRKDLIKLVGEKAEKGRVSIRQMREEIKEEITRAFRDSEISEDEFYAYKKELDEITSEYVAQIDSLKEKKESSILEIS